MEGTIRSVTGRYWKVIGTGQGAGGPFHGVSLQSGLNFWSPLPGSGQREVGHLPCPNRREGGEDAGERALTAHASIRADLVKGARSALSPEGINSLPNL